jgi:hypothetical protein
MSQNKSLLLLNGFSQVFVAVMKSLTSTSPESKEQHFLHYPNNSGSLPKCSKCLFWIDPEVKAIEIGAKSRLEGQDQGFSPYGLRNGPIFLTELPSDIKH